MARSDRESEEMKSRRVRTGRATVWLLVLTLVGLAPEAFAQSRIWATYGSADTGPPAGPIGLTDGEGMVVHLWASSGSQPSLGPPCQKGAVGDEICGLAFGLLSTGGFEILAFSPNPFFDSARPPAPFAVTPLSQTELKANAFDLGVPGVANRWLGTLTLRGTGIGSGSTVGVSGRLVGSNLEMRNLVEETFIVPEPGFAGALVCATGLLSLLARPRLRS